MGKKKGFLYHLCAIVGWSLILIGIIGLFFMLVANDPHSKKLAGYLVCAGILVSGVLIAMVAEKNIFKAFGVALDYLSIF